MGVFQTKYNVGDEVWFRFCGQIESGTIACIEIYGPCKVFYRMKVNCVAFMESDLFPTKEDLIANL